MITNERAQNAASISTAKLATLVKKDSTAKFRSAGQPAGITSKMLGDNRYSPNPAPATANSDPFVNFSPNKMHKLEQEDRSSSISDTDDSCSVQLEQAPGKALPAPGKKTRGRVKIQMEYIQNKLRRYTTFSKRKSGMMKKAYELSTLTGTQVMLLVASETGHVYTFATPKLQPMITSEAGKALIQTCLHQPDPPSVVVPPPGDFDMRMSVNGFEETELGYQMSEEDYKNGMDPNLHHVSTAAPMPAILNHGPIVTIPHGMMPLHGFPPSSCIPAETHPMTSQALNTTIMSHAPMAHVQPAQALSPPHHSPPPSYSPPQPASPPHASPYTPTSMPHQPVMIDDLSSPSLAHHGHLEAYDRSPSHSPIQHRYSHSPQTLYSAAAGGSPSMAGHRM